MSMDPSSPSLLRRPVIGRRRLLRGMGASVCVLAVGSLLPLRESSATGALTPARPALPPAAPPPIRFEVIRGGDVIGSHNVDFEGAGSEFSVSTRIDITVRVLGVPAFIFRHESTEHWADGRLQAFDSKTNDDGSDFFVTGRAEAGSFKIINRKGTEVAPADIMVGSYWTPLIARQTQLIDPQRGRVKSQQLLSTDAMTIQARNGPVQATRYRVIGVTDGWVAYDGAGRWLAAELKKKGSDILYRLPK